MGWPWEVTLHPERLDAPLHWRKPQVVATAYMGDLWHEGVPDEFIDKVFATMALTQWHAYLLLTKRPARLLAYLMGLAVDIANWPLPTEKGFPRIRAATLCRLLDWPLPNVWLSVSVENQATADERIPLLLETPAAHRWVSFEPLLGEILLDASIKELDWAVIGGESGPKARPMNLAWMTQLVAFCDTFKVPCYVKQDSHRYPSRQGRIPTALWERKAVPWEPTL